MTGFNDGCAVHVSEVDEETVVHSNQINVMGTKAINFRFACDELYMCAYCLPLVWNANSWLHA